MQGRTCQHLRAHSSYGEVRKRTVLDLGTVRGSQLLEDMPLRISILLCSVQYSSRYFEFIYPFPSVGELKNPAASCTSLRKG